MPPHVRLAIWVAAILAVTFLAMVIVEPDGRGWLEYAAIGFFFGSLFAHPTLASAWAALGPGPLIWRIPLSLVWVGLLILCLAVHVALDRVPSDAIAVVGVCLIGQYIALQFPLWLLVVGFRLGVRHSSETDAGASKQLQFGIRQLLVVTAIAAGLMGAGRIALAAIPTRGEYPIFIFLVVAAIIQTVPLLLAVLMRSYAIPAVLGILVLIGFATYWELTLLQLLKLGRGSPDIGHFIGINSFTVLLTLIVAVTVRLNGFYLHIRGPAQSAQ